MLLIERMLLLFFVDLLNGTRKFPGSPGRAGIPRLGILDENRKPEFPQGKRIKTRSSFEVLPRENGRPARLETDFRMKTP